MWGWIHLYGVGELAQIEGRFKAEQYLEILEEVMLPSVRAIALPYPETIVFMQDNCSIHTAKIVKKWFEEQRNLELMPWPSRSCDLNPIENVWGNIVNCWEQTIERSSTNLFHHTQRDWEALRRRPHVVYNNVASMSNRLQAVVEKGGGWTKY